MKIDNGRIFHYIVLLVLELVSSKVLALDAMLQESDYLYARWQDGTERQWLPFEKIATNDVKMLLDHAAHAEHHKKAIEVSVFALSAQTTQQKMLADKLSKDMKDAALKHNWYSYKKAAADGFVRTDSLNDVHFVNKKYLLDDEVLNPDKPEFLMFYKTDKGMLLAGAMFMVKHQLDHGPQPGGNETVWHYHEQANTCWENLLPIGLAVNRKCAKGMLYDRSPEMMHVWITPNSQGRFAASMVTSTEEMVKDDFVVSRADKK